MSQRSILSNNHQILYDSIMELDNSIIDLKKHYLNVEENGRYKIDNLALSYGILAVFLRDALAIYNENYDEVKVIPLIITQEYQSEIKSHQDLSIGFKNEIAAILNKLDELKVLNASDFVFCEELVSILENKRKILFRQKVNGRN